MDHKRVLNPLKRDLLLTLALLSIFAGLAVFGLSGVVYGPVLMNVVPVTYRALKYRLLHNHQSQDSKETAN